MLDEQEPGSNDVTEPQDGAADWIIDDPGIPEDAFAHRRLTDSQQVVFDDLLGRSVLNISAYTYRDDGMSVYVSTAMAELELSDDELMPHCEHGLARVPVSVVRRRMPGKSYSKGDVTSTVAADETLETAGGVIMSDATDGPEDTRIRKSHGLVRIHERPVARRLWNAFRHKLLMGSEYRASVNDGWHSVTEAA